MAKRQCKSISYNYIESNTDFNSAGPATNSQNARRAVLKVVAHHVDKQLTDLYSNTSYTLNQLNTFPAEPPNDEFNYAGLHSSNSQDHSAANPDNVDLRQMYYNYSELDDIELTDIESSDFQSSDEDDMPDLNCEYGNSNLNVHENKTVTKNIGLKELLDDCKELPLKDQLWLWALECGVPLTHLTKLLKILHPFHKELPKDARTLLLTPRKLNMQANLIENGKFHYFGIASNLKERIVQLSLKESNEISLTFNIDGLPLFKSSNSQFWPILGAVDDATRNIKPFVVGIFFGVSKPSSVFAFMDGLVKELNYLLQNGFVFESTCYKIRIRAFICDAPARSFLKVIKSHSGYYSCEKCDIKGDYIEGKVAFPVVDNLTERTDSSFRLQSQKEHHIGSSPLCSLPIDIIKCFPLDSMHLLWLGVMRRFLVTWVNGKPSKSKLSAKQVHVISSRIESYSPYMPSEFGRKPRGLQHLNRWKATEFRQFLLYIGVTALKGELKMEYYNHFLTLHVAVTILQSVSHRQKYHAYADALLVNFVRNVIQLYGKQMMVYNIHGLLHLAKDVEIHSEINKITAFPFEDFLGKLKKLVRSPNVPLEQVCNRIAELSNRDVNASLPQNYFSVLDRPHEEGPLPLLTGDKQYVQYKNVSIPSKRIILNSEIKDRCVELLDGRIMAIKNILKVTSSNDVFIYCTEFRRKKSLYSNPCKSYPYVGICEVSRETEGLFIINLLEIKQKCVHLPISETQYAIFPMLH